jgi:uncharacterized repeat protein (TIGR03803 family)
VTRIDQPARLAALMILLACALSVKPASAQKEKILYTFGNGTTDGQFPAWVVRDPADSLHGVTFYGGTLNLGTVFKLSKTGEVILYNFQGGEDGALAVGLLLDVAGNAYGITSNGGDTACNSGKGCGTVFKLDASGKETVLHRFSQSAADGGYPTSLIQDSKGGLYGTTAYGGPANVGTVFKIDATGKETVLYSFTGGTGGADGANPNGVTLDGHGNLYGTTSEGGPGNTGVVFKVDPVGNETVLYTFTGGNGSADGKNPNGNLVRDAAGNLYGTTSIGGTANLGTLFKLDTSGKETILHNFGFPGDGAYPENLVMDKAGNLYGNTSDGGAFAYGAVYKFDTSGNETILHSFGGSGDGQYPVGDLVLDSAGRIYGVTQQGGASGWGTVFVIIP